MNNTTEITNTKPLKILLSVLPCFFFLYVNVVMLFTLHRKPVFLESSRYILFAHLLLTDSLQLLVSIVLYIFAVGMFRVFALACHISSLLANITLKLSPLNLAVMSLERYVAVCFPLRHSDIATTKRTHLAIAVLWIVVSVDSSTQVSLFISLQNETMALSNTVICHRNRIFQKQVDSLLNKAFVVMYFVLVSIVIIFTYIAVMMIVKSASSNVHEATKAHKTVLLHLLQLCLCLVSLLYNIINSSHMSSLQGDVAIHVHYVLFVGFILFPKCLSPLIYGLRDHAFRKVFKYYFTFGL
ncbi:olfactory receptor 2T1-like [Solea senegalensis]|uniref:Olfactory receptor 2T1-like n=1 Tax=Solea senegalensis TaxID=28829 RepID=A0AAV6SJ28_SOLSE|nr:odorant receptor 131-2-like [Solea senegalensis]KAG7516915.1 olfactory receptor 2T1-like [Solea senegalensis]